MEKLKVVFVPLDIIWHNPKANREKLDEVFAQLSEVDLIVLPEMFTTGFTLRPEEIAENHPGETLAWMQKWAQALDCGICGSVAVRDGDAYYNRFYCVSPDSEVIYDKKHLFSYAKEHAHYSAGEEQVEWSLKGWRIRTIVCYDLRFPVWCRQKKTNEEPYDLLLCVANWPEARLLAWHSLLQARAIENMAYCLGVNRTGTDDNEIRYPANGSKLYDALGQETPYKLEQGFAQLTLDKKHLRQSRERFGFLSDGDLFELL